MTCYDVKYWNMHKHVYCVPCTIFRVLFIINYTLTEHWASLFRQLVKLFLSKVLYWFGQCVTSLKMIMKYSATVNFWRFIQMSYSVHSNSPSKAIFLPNIFLMDFPIKKIRKMLSTILRHSSVYNTLNKMPDVDWCATNPHSLKFA